VTALENRYLIVFALIYPVYGAGVWLLHSHLGGLRWYLWVAAMILALLIFYVVMVALWILEHRKYGKPAICSSCGDIHDHRIACPFCGAPVIK